MNAEEVKVGCFQIVLAFLLAVNYVVVAMSHALPVFHNYTPKFYCQTKNNTNREYGCSNSSMNVTLDQKEPEACDYRFVTEFGENSVATEWFLICEKQYLTIFGPSVYYLGVLIGAYLCGLFADRIGRLPVQAICLYAQGTMAVALYVVQSYPAFLALRGLQGVFVQGLQNSTYILALELFPQRKRALVALIMQIAWALGLVLLALLSYMVPDWRILQLAISVPTAVTVLYIWIIPESPRWLLARGKSTEADMALERIAKYNGCCGKPKKETAKETPVKPERKSRVSSVDLRKTKENERTQEEVKNLLESPQQTPNRKTSLKSASENLEKRLSENEDQKFEKSDGPSGSKADRRSKSISQRISMRNVEEIVELKPKKEKTSENEVESNTQNLKKKAVQNLRTLFQRSLPRRYIFVMSFQWFTCYMVHYLVGNLVPNFSVNRHVTFALGGALEIATYSFIYFVVTRYGRKVPTCACQSLNGIVCIVLGAFIIFTSQTVWSDLTRTVILLFGRITAISTIFIVYLYTVEIFPTVIRGSCLGLCGVFAKIGSLCTMHVTPSGEQVSIVTSVIIAGILCLLSGAFALLLPETLSKVLPDTLEDTEELIVVKREKKASPSKENKEDLTEQEILRDKLFSEDWVDAGNGILVNFTENKASD